LRSPSYSHSFFSKMNEAGFIPAPVSKVSAAAELEMGLQLRYAS
jgi:hypothetical protein